MELQYQHQQVSVNLEVRLEAIVTTCVIQETLKIEYIKVKWYMLPGRAWGFLCAFLESKGTGAKCRKKKIRVVATALFWGWFFVGPYH